MSEEEALLYFCITNFQEIEKVIALFEKVDLEHNGKVNKEEFKALLEELKKSGAATVAGSADKMLVDLVFSALDKDDSGDLNLEEILAGYHTLFADERMELARLLSPSFPSLSEKQIVDILKLFERFDDNGNGLIDKHEFYQLKQELAPSIVEVLQQIQREKGGPLVESDFLVAYQRIFGSKSDTSAAQVAAAALTSALREPCCPESASHPPAPHDEAAPRPLPHPPTPSPPSSQPAPLPSAKAQEPTPRPLPTPPSTSSAAPASASTSSPAPSAPPTAAPARPTVAEVSPSCPAAAEAPRQPSATTTAPTAAVTAAGDASATSTPPNEGSTRAAGPSQLWDAFVASEEPLEVRRLWTELKSACGANDAPGGSAYESVRNRLMSLPRWKPFFQLLDKKRKQKEYALDAKEQPRVFIVGAGPGGMRTAIEALLLGSRVTLVEMRKRFTRHNLLHVWMSSIRDLRNIGAKFLYPQFCTGGINHVAIRRLQLVLLKVALLLGLNYYRASYVSSQAPTNPASNPLWKANEPINEDDLHFNVLVGADGERSCLADEFAFERKLFKGSDAIGITANFVNTQTPEEKQLDEFGLLSIYNQQFFNELKAKSDIELENLVYYRNETHYFVMTAKRTSLLRKGVLRQDGPLETVLSRDNVDCAQLEHFVREVADHISLPAHCQFMKKSRGGNDVAIFDFSKKQQATSPAKIMREGQAKLLVAIVGDALVEPFWPQGTGANRAILGALDTAWMIKTFFERGGSPEQDQPLLDEWVAEFKVMVSSSPDDLQSNLGAFTIDPKTRYKKTTVTHFM